MIQAGKKRKYYKEIVCLQASPFWCPSVLHGLQMIPASWLKSAGSCRSGLRHPWNRSSVEKNKTEKMRFLILFIFAKRREESSLKSPAYPPAIQCLSRQQASLVPFCPPNTSVTSLFFPVTVPGDSVSVTSRQLLGPATNALLSPLIPSEGGTS